MKDQMKAAVLKSKSEKLTVQEVKIPKIRHDEVLVKVESSGVVQNFKNIIKAILKGDGRFSFPKLPAVLGLDVSGTVQECGSSVNGFKEGDRVYVNPGYWCRTCRECRSGNEINCTGFMLKGYFGIGADSQFLLDANENGGFAQFVPARAENLVLLPGNITFDQAARMGYLGTAYRGLKLSGFKRGDTILINGITGTLGVGAVALAISMGAKKILGTATKTEMFPKLKAMGGEGQIQILDSTSGSLKDWCMEQTDGEGVDSVIDALGSGAPTRLTSDAFSCLKRGGGMTYIGAAREEVPLDLFWAMSNNIKVVGSSWFTTADAIEMMDLIESGDLSLDYLEEKTCGLDGINEAIKNTDDGNGGFTNFVLKPN